MGLLNALNAQVEFVHFLDIIKNLVISNKDLIIKVFVVPPTKTVRVLQK